MVAQDKLIKQGIKYTDALFDEISNRLEQGIRTSDTLEAFLNKTKGYTENNPLVTTGYDKEMLKIILAETNNHKYSRPSQKELIRVTIENQVGDLIKDVGDDIKETVRDIVKQGYDNNLSQDEIAQEISDNVSVIKNKRAKTIARTEIARTATISDYIINKEMGATHFYVECRNTACPICKEAWHKHWSQDKDESFNPKSTSAGGKGWIGDVEFGIEDVSMLPPIHPNCRCVPYFIKKEGGETSTPKPQPDTLPDPTPEQIKKNLTPAERDKYENYKRNIPKQQQWLRDHPDAPADEIAKHQKRLAFLEKKFAELKRKALGGSVKPGKPKPQQQPKPKPKSKPVINMNPEPTPKPKDNRLPHGLIYGTPNNRPLTRLELGNLSKREHDRWVDLNNQIKWAERVMKSNSPGDYKYEFALKRLEELGPEWRTLNRKAVRLEKEKRKRIISQKGQTIPEVDTPKGIGAYGKPIDSILTKQEVDALSFDELAAHHNAKYLGSKEYYYDGRNYHMFEQEFQGSKFTVYFEDKAVKSFNDNGVATANEIIHEVFKSPRVLRKETNEIWFKNKRREGVMHRPTQSGYDSYRENVGGYNVSWILRPDLFYDHDDPEHKIMISPRYFKEKPDDDIFGHWGYPLPNRITNWKHTIHHELQHSGDKTRAMWKHRKLKVNSDEREYMKVHNAEPYFTNYANSKVSESMAEHGGYIAYMEANPSEQSKKIELYVPDEHGRYHFKHINYEEYKQEYPEHHKYFMKKFKEGF